MPQNETQSNKNSDVKPVVKQTDKMAPIQKGTFRQNANKLGSVVKSARKAQKKSDK